MQNLSQETLNRFKECVTEGSRLVGTEVSVNQVEQMSRYSGELLLWNRKTNLTAIKEPLQIAEKHFVDSIAALPLFMESQRVMDMGSGGGFPGIPLKIIMPSLQIVLVDSSRKKINFLKHVIRVLKLDGIDAIHTRAEDLHSDSQYQGRFDVVISRAFSELAFFVQLSLPFLGQGGQIFAMKGKKSAKEVTPDISGRFDIDLHPYELPFEKSERHILRLSLKA